MTLLDQLQERGVTAEDLEKAAAVRLFEKAASAEGVNLDALSTEQVSDLFEKFTSNFQSTKEASAMNNDVIDLFEKTASDEGIDLDALSEEELRELFQHYVDNVLPGQTDAAKEASDTAAVVEMFQKTAAAEGIDLEEMEEDAVQELFQHYVENVLPEQLSAENGDDSDAEKVASAHEKLAEAEILGRHMARAYADEMNKIGAKYEVDGGKGKPGNMPLALRGKTALVGNAAPKGGGMRGKVLKGVGALAATGALAYGGKKMYDRKKAEKTASFDGREVAALLRISEAFGAGVAFDTAEKLAEEKDDYKSVGERDTAMATERATRMSDTGIGQYLNSTDRMKKQLVSGAKGGAAGAVGGGALGAAAGALGSSRGLRRAGALIGGAGGAATGGTLGFTGGAHYASEKDLRERGIKRHLYGILGSSAGSEMTSEARKKYLGEKNASVDEIDELAAHMLEFAGYEIN